MASKSLNDLPFAGFRAPGPGESAASVRRVSLAEASYSTLSALLRAPADGGGGSIASTADGGPGSRGPGGDGPGAPGSSFAGAAGAAPRVDGGVVAALEASDAYEAFARALDEVAAAAVCAAAALDVRGVSLAVVAVGPANLGDVVVRMAATWLGGAAPAAWTLPAEAVPLPLWGPPGRCPVAAARAAAASRERAAADDVLRATPSRDPGAYARAAAALAEAAVVRGAARRVAAVAGAGGRSLASPAVLAATAGAAQAALAHEPAWAKFAGAASDFFSLADRCDAAAAVMRPPSRAWERAAAPAERVAAPERAAAPAERGGSLVLTADVDAFGRVGVRGGGVRGGIRAAREAPAAPAVSPAGSDGADRGRGGPAAAPAAPKWSCVACTFKNLPLDSTCDVCGEPRPGAAPPTRSGDDVAPGSRRGRSASPPPPEPKRRAVVAPSTRTTRSATRAAAPAPTPPPPPLPVSPPAAPPPPAVAPPPPAPPPRPLTPGKNQNRAVVPKESAQFPAKLREILENPRHALVIAWRAETQSFRVLDKRAFCERVLPAYFKLKTPAGDGDGPKKMFACFVRQLSYYGFHKMVRHVDEWRVVDDATITSPGDFSRLKRHLPASRAANRL